ncbi:MAG: trypsin-like peptidase domain-containing protein [Ruminococcus sp.]|nr:trypsin-like peptidase domain-containing protein [Ruminococcus sp.]
MDEIQNYNSGNYPEQENNPPQHEETTTAYTRFVYDRIPNDFQAVPELPESIRKRKNTSGEKFIIFLFVVIIMLAIGLSIYGIANDVYRSQSVIEELRKQQHIVLYQEEKPDGANDLSNFIDENGKYTIEGVANAVKDSIVEIYAYSNEKQTKLEGTGSGVVISDDGYIVTNAHVLKENGFHTVHTTDDKIYNAIIIGRDSKTDIAIIKVDNAGLTPAVLGDSDEAIVGEQVIAVGNPAGLSNTVTDGIISAVNRKIRSDSTGFEMNCIQTNADISPGNSGGALVNMYGQVIGITSSKYVSSSFEGLGFAITINDALPIIEQLIDMGYVSGRFRIGIQLIDMDSEEKVLLIENEIGFELPDGFEGIYIDSISEDCDIANTDLKAGDFIIEIDGTPVKTYDELYNNISSKYGAGDTVPAKCANVQKNGKVTYYDIEFKLMEDTSGDF